MIVRFVIPNRDDPDKPPTLYEEWGMESVPRVGEAVSFFDQEGNDTGTWRVKEVWYDLQLGLPPKPNVRLIEPDHWTQR